MNTIKMIIVAILAMAFTAFPAVAAADQTKQVQTQKPQIQRVAAQSQKSQQDFSRQYNNRLARSCTTSADCRKPAKVQPPVDIFSVLGK